MNEKQVGRGGRDLYTADGVQRSCCVKYCLYVYYYLNIVNGFLEEEDDKSSD